MKFVQLHYFLS